MVLLKQSGNPLESSMKNNDRGNYRLLCLGLEGGLRNLIILGLLEKDENYQNAQSHIFPRQCDTINEPTSFALSI